MFQRSSITSSPILLVLLLLANTPVGHAGVDEETSSWACVKTSVYWSASCEGEPWRALSGLATIPSKPLCLAYDDPHDGSDGEEHSAKIYCNLATNTYHGESYLGSSECNADKAHMSNVDTQESGFCIGTFLGGFVIECTAGPCEDDDDAFPPSSTIDFLTETFQRQEMLVSHAKQHATMAPRDKELSLFVPDIWGEAQPQETSTN